MEVLGDICYVACVPLIFLKTCTPEYISCERSTCSFLCFVL